MSIIISLLLLQSATAPGQTQVAATPPDDAKIVCRTINETGSRLGGKRVCMSKKEWRRMHDEARENAKFFTDNQSKRPGEQ